jgi:hypothetical protein
MEMMIPKFNLDLNLGSFKIIVDDDYSGWCGHSGHSLSLSGSERTSPIDGCFVFFGQFGTHCIALLDIPISPFWMMTFL